MFKPDVYPVGGPPNPIINPVGFYC